jgi:hypothetical protein
MTASHARNLEARVAADAKQKPSPDARLSDAAHDHRILHRES